MSPHTLSRVLLLSALGFLASCGGGGLSSTGGTVGPGAGSGGGDGDGVLFALADLDGDWTGELLPANGLRGDRNLFLRMFNGDLIEAAEGGGGAWDPGTSTLAVIFGTDGFLDLTLDNAVSGSLRLQGTMNLTRNTIIGSFSMNDGVRPPYGGNFELRLSSGAVTFPNTLFVGEWSGEVLNSADNFRLSQLIIDVDGNLVEAALTKPSSSAIVHHYLPAGNELAFNFDGPGVGGIGDVNIGLLNQVILYATDGSTLTFDYLLINDTGTLMSGPGVDSQLGTGHVELRRPAN